MPRRIRRKIITELVKVANGRSPRGTFHHAVNATASEINKGGIRRQIQFLLNYLGPAATQELVDDLMKLETRINDLTSQAIRGDRLGLLVRTVYHMKMQEAHQLAHAKPRTIVRHLVRELGPEKVNKLIHGVGDVKHEEGRGRQAANDGGLEGPSQAEEREGQQDADGSE